MSHEGHPCRAASFIYGKRPGRPSIASAGLSSGTISIVDSISGRSFLIDSGADECVFPATANDRRLQRTTDLVAANGSTIHTYGKRQLEVSFGSGPPFHHSFWIATIRRPILGADFFTSHGLLIDMPRRRLLSSSGAVFQAVPTSPPSISGLWLPTSGPYEAILKGFPSLLEQNFAGQVKHQV